jgi:hypothetical protein
VPPSAETVRKARAGLGQGRSVETPTRSKCRELHQSTLSPPLDAAREVRSAVRTRVDACTAAPTRRAGRRAQLRPRPSAPRASGRHPRATLPAQTAAIRCVPHAPRLGPSFSSGSVALIELAVTSPGERGLVTASSRLVVCTRRSLLCAQARSVQSGLGVGAHREARRALLDIDRGRRPLRSCLDRAGYCAPRIPARSRTRAGDAAPPELGRRACSRPIAAPSSSPGK